MEFGILGDMGQVRSKVRPLNFKKASFQLLKEMICRIPWETSLGDKESEQSCRSLRKSSTELKSWQSPGARNQARKSRDGHGRVGTYLSKERSTFTGSLS